MISFYPGYFGWLGNQMFQYATTFAASKRANQQCAFPENEPNLFELFTLSSEKIDRPQGFSIYKEPHFHYEPLPEIEQSTTLHGYFQSEKYFADYADEVKAEFVLRTPKYPEELDQEYIALHVRRGDYLNHPDTHPTCSVEYYTAALEMLPDKPVKIFTDDYDWCSKTFKGNRFSISNENFINDFELMTKCHYHIIANSSFSWWAAWLSDSKKVIAPKKWFGPKAPGSSKDIIPDTWTTI